VSTYDAWATPARAPIPRRSLLLHGLLLVATVTTTTMAGALWEGVDPLSGFSFLLDGLPFSLTFLAILLTHESGHYVMCRWHGVNASLPYFLPAPPIIFPLGTFGAFIRIRSRFPDRRALFDIGAGGPWAGFVVALVALVYGLSRSTILSAPMTSGGLELGDSLLTSFLTRVVLDADPTTVVLHPVAFAGWLGMLVTSINLLPAGQLDGGHVLYAAFQRRTRFVPFVLVAALVWLGWTGWSGWLVWAVLITVLVGLRHPPTLDDPRPLGAARTVGAIMSFVLFAVTFVPEPFRLLP
jgi:membrane-associated protease RseP (regulator of RpoE activity)